MTGRHFFCCLCATESEHTGVKSRRIVVYADEEKKVKKEKKVEEAETEMLGFSLQDESTSRSAKEVGSDIV